MSLALTNVYIFAYSISIIVRGHLHSPHLWHTMHAILLYNAIITTTYQSTYMIITGTNLVLLTKHGLMNKTLFSDWYIKTPTDHTELNRTAFVHILSVFRIILIVWIFSCVMSAFIKRIWYGMVVKWQCDYFIVVLIACSTPSCKVIFRWWWWWWWLSICKAHYAGHLYCATCSVRCEEVSFQRWSERVKAKWWITEMVRQQVPGPWTCNGECSTSMQRCRGTFSWWRVADLRRWRLAISDVRVQQSIKYCGALLRYQ